jgi:hypothetical protein
MPAPIAADTRPASMLAVVADGGAVEPVVFDERPATTQFASASTAWSARARLPTEST